MNNNNKEKYFLGYPCEFEHLCLIYPPKIKDVLTVPNYNAFVHLLTISQEDIEDEYTLKDMDFDTLLTPLEYLLNNAYYVPEVRTIAQDGFKFFLHESVHFDYINKQIIIGEIESLENLRIIDEDNYLEFQNEIRLTLGLKPEQLYDENEDPRIKKMKAKARYRDKVKAKKGKGPDFYSLLTSICCMDMGLNPLNIGELSYSAFLALVERYQLKESYQLSVDSLLAGADSKKVKPKYWICNLEEEN